MLERKLTNVGFGRLTTPERRPFGLAALGKYPLFPAEFLDFVRAVVPQDRHDAIVFSVVITAEKPG